MMSREKQIKIALVAFAILLISSCYIAWTDNSDDPEKEGTVVFETDKELITSLEIIRDGKTIEIKPGDDKARVMFDAVSEIRSRQRFRRVTDLAEYGLKPPAFTVILHTDDKVNDGKELHFGDYAKSLKRNFLQFDDEDFVYLVSTEFVAIFD